jgi:hypothetical protein
LLFLSTHEIVNHHCEAKKTYERKGEDHCQNWGKDHGVCAFDEWEGERDYVVDERHEIGGSH